MTLLFVCTFISDSFLADSQSSVIYIKAKWMYITGQYVQTLLSSDPDVRGQHNKILSE